MFLTYILQVCNRYVTVCKDTFESVNGAQFFDLRSYNNNLIYNNRINCYVKLLIIKKFVGVDV